MAIPLAVAAGLALVNTGMGIAQKVKAGQQKREAEEASAKFAADIRQRLLERRVGKQALPMRGYDLAKEGLAQRYATGVSALQSAGAEGVLGGLGGLMRQQTEAELALAAQIQNMEYKRDLEYQNRLDRERDLQYQTRSHLDFMNLKGAQGSLADAAALSQAGTESIVGGLGTAAEMGLKYSSLYPKTGAATGEAVGGVSPELQRLRGGQAEYENLQRLRGGQAAYEATQPTLANKAGFMGPYPTPNYGPFQPNYNLHNLWDPTTNPFGGPQRPNPFGVPQSQNPWSFQGAGANPYTVPSMNIGSSSWLGGNSYP